MPIYSHSRLSTFEECPKKFKFKYLDKIRPPIEKTMETHLGKVVHESLEWLYSQVKDKNYIPSLDEVLIYYKRKWEHSWDDAIKNVKKRYTKKDYYNQGVEYLINYYMKHKPFDDNTIDVEKKIIIELDKDGRYKIQGFIDRLVYNLENQEYEIHDYKTSSRLPKLEDVENDRQLALYSIAIKENFGHDKNVKLVWHYLAYNRKIKSQRTNPQLDKLKQDTINLIREIESTENFPTRISRLCDWCEYKPICPAWNKNPPKTKQEAEKLLQEINGKIKRENQKRFRKEKFKEDKKLENKFKNKNRFKRGFVNEFKDK